MSRSVVAVAIFCRSYSPALELVRSCGCKGVGLLSTWLSGTNRAELTWDALFVPAVALFVLLQHLFFTHNFNVYSPAS